MTLEQIEARVNLLERQLSDLQRLLRSFNTFPNVESTFGLFADDAGYDEVLRLGRAYRDQQNRQQQDR